MKYGISLVLGSLFAVFPTQGATIFVTTVTQRITGGPGCSLQEAIGAANADSSQIHTYDTYAAPITVATQCIAGNGADSIILPAGGVFQLQSIVNDADNPAGPTATPIITSDITIEANGATLQWTSTARARLFTVGSTGRLTIRNAYIKGFTTKGGDGADGGGGGMGAGGAIYVMNGRLIVDSSTFDSNVAAGGNGSAYFTDAGGGGGGLAGNGSAPAASATIIGGGGGGGSRANGSAGALTDPVDRGGDGGGTVSGANTGGGAGGNVNLNLLIFCVGSGGDGENGGPGGGGGGGGGPIALLGCFGGGNAGTGGYGGGGGGGGDPAGSGNDGGFGGGGGSASNNDTLRATGGNAGFGGGAGSGDSLFGGPGHSYRLHSGGSDLETLGGTADNTHGGGGSGFGGAIFNDSGSVTITNSTFANNVAVRGVSGGGSADNGIDAGGAVFSRNGILEVIDSTVSANQGTGSGAGIVVMGDPLAYFTLNNTIIYGNGAQECFVRGPVAFVGVGNLIGSNGGGGSSFIPCPGAVTGADPGLGPLRTNFPGSTPTMAISQNSPAFNTADGTTSLSIDQRGEPRPSMGGFDIGAFELCIDRIFFNVCMLPPVTAQTAPLTIQVAPPGGGTTNPAPGTYNYALDFVASLKATPNAGFSFLNWTGNVADPNSATTAVITGGPQAVTANFVTGDTMLGGNILTKSGPQNQRAWPVNIADSGVVIAHNTQIDTFTLTQTAGAACTPSPHFVTPISVGDISPGNSARVNLIFDFTNCAANARFTVQAAFSANGGGATGSMTRTNQLP